MTENTYSPTTNTYPRPATPREKAEARFITAVTGTPPTDEQKATVLALRAAAIEFGALLESLPDSRDKSLALTHLEDALIRGNRSVFVR